MSRLCRALVLIMMVACGSTAPAATPSATTGPATPSTTPAPAPSFQSSGLGLTRAEWEQRHGPGSPAEAPIEGTTVACYEQDTYCATFAGGDPAIVVLIQRRYPREAYPGVEAALAEGRALLPVDARLQFKGMEEGVPVEVYYSPGLVGRVPADQLHRVLWFGGRVGSVVLGYNRSPDVPDSGHVVLMFVGAAGAP